MSIIVELSLYKIAAKEILKNYKKLPNTKEILSSLDKLQGKKNALMQEYSLNINATIRVYTFGNLKMYKIDSSVIMILR